MTAVAIWLALIALCVALGFGIKRYDRLDDERARRAATDSRRRLLAELDRIDREAEG